MFMGLYLFLTELKEICSKLVPKLITKNKIYQREIIIQTSSPLSVFLIFHNIVQVQVQETTLNKITKILSDIFSSAIMERTTRL